MLKTFFFIHQRISQRAVRTSLEKKLDPEVQLLLEGGPEVQLLLEGGPEVQLLLEGGPYQYC